MARGNGAAVSDVTVAGTTFKRGRRRRAEGFVFGPPQFVADNEPKHPLTEEMLARMRSFYADDPKAYPAVVTTQAELDAACSLEKAMPICKSTDADFRFQIRPVSETAKTKTVFVVGACQADAYDRMTVCALEISEVALYDAVGYGYGSGCLQVHDGSKAILREHAMTEITNGNIEIDLDDLATAVVDSGGAVVLARGLSAVYAERASLVVLEQQAQLKPTTIRADGGGSRESKVRKVVMNDCSKLGPLDKAYVEIQDPWCMLSQMPAGVRFDPTWKKEIPSDELQRISKKLIRENRIPHVQELPQRASCVYCGKPTTNERLVAYRFGVCAACSRSS